MSLFSSLGSILNGGLLDGVTKVKETFSSNKERDAQRLHEIDRSSIYNTSQVSRQYQSEFGHNKTWFDSLVNGLNRLQRPAFVGTFLYLCILLPILDPELATIAYSSLELVPEYLWYAFLTIMTFLFGGRPIEKVINQRDEARRMEALSTVKRLQDSREERLEKERADEEGRKRIEEDKKQDREEKVQEKTPFGFGVVETQNTEPAKAKGGERKGKKRPSGEGSARGSSSEDNRAAAELIDLVRKQGLK